MATAISQRIALEGAEEVKRNLQQIGQLGERSFQQISSGVQQTSGALRTYSATATQSAGATRQLDGALSGTVGTISTLAKTLGVLSVSLAGIGAAILAAAKNASGAAAEIGKAAIKAKASASDFQQSVLSLQLLGLTGGEAESAFKKAGEAGATAFEKAKEAIKALGIRMPETEAGIAAMAKQMEVMSRVSVNGKNAIDQQTGALLRFRDGLNPENLKAFAEQLKNIKDKSGETQRTLAEAAFGQDIGRVLLPALLKGSAGIDEVLKDINELRLGFDEAQIAVGTKFVAAMARFNIAAKQGRTELGLLFAPAATQAILTWTNLMRQNRAMLQGWAETISSSVRPVLEDLFRLFREGSGARIDTGWVSTLRDGLVAVGNLITSVIRPAFESLKAAFASVAGLINQAFGTKLTAADVGIAGVITFLIGGINTLGIAILALFADKAPAAVQKFKDSLASFGINIDAIKASVSGFAKQVAEDLKAITEGRTGDVKFTWLIDLKNALTSLPAVLAEVALLFGLLLRIAATRPAIALTAFLLNLTGLLPILTFAINALVAAVAILASILTIIGVAFGATAVLIAGLVVVAGVAALAIWLFWDQVKAAAQAAWEAIKSGWQALWNSLKADWELLRGAAAQAWQAVQDAALAAWQAILTGAQAVWQFLAGGWTSVTDAALAAFDGLVTGVVERFNALIKAAKETWDYIKGLFGFGGGESGEAGASVGQFASGGAVRGPGTSTSDSILARLSNGEFVVRAAAVKKYGVNRLAALNAMRAPRFNMGGLVDGLSRLLSPMMVPRFNMGGLVDGLSRLLSPMMVPRFNMGGLVDGLSRSLSPMMVPGLATGGVPDMAATAGGRPLVFNFPSGAKFNGSVVDVMGTFEREALALQNASTGTKPSWVGGR